VKPGWAGFTEYNDETINTYRIVVGKYRRKVLLWRITIHNAAVSGAVAII
jgi:hypothetical protein